LSRGEDNDSDEVGSLSPEPCPEEQLHAPAVHSEGQNENITWESDEGGPVPQDMEEEGTEMDQGNHEMENAIQVQNITLAEETTKRRERRQAKAMREKECLRRKKEGLPMNFLLVDEYTMKPYGVGVGDWKKELHVLSKNLDPAIGNINQQPEGAVEEIAEWIQHTWEYSSPIKFAYVKEVIARGVTLRRADIWKKMRNQEPQPDGISDRSWRTLARQLESPATIRKSQSCSKANASRVNFGRTGPSGEVGVQERLRRKLGRSPNPEEIRYEMARNKGYGGHYRQKKEYMNVMHDRDGVGQLALEGAPIAGPSDNSCKSIRSQHDHDGHDVDVGGRSTEESLSQGRRSADPSKRPLHEISAEEVAQHPLVMRMMERLEALEGRHTTIVDDRSASTKNSVDLQEVHQSMHRAKRHKTIGEVQVGWLLYNVGSSQVVKVLMIFFWNQIFSTVLFTDRQYSSVE